MLCEKSPECWETQRRDQSSVEWEQEQEASWWVVGTSFQKLVLQDEHELSEIGQGGASPAGTQRVQADLPSASPPWALLKIQPRSYLCLLLILLHPQTSPCFCFGDTLISSWLYPSFPSQVCSSKLALRGSHQFNFLRHWKQDFFDPLR